MEDINLTSNKATQKKQASKFLIGSLIIFLVVFVTGAALVIYSFLLKSQGTKLEEEKAQIKSSISVYALQKEKLSTLTERLANIRRIISQRSSIDSKVELILSTVPTNLGIDKINADDIKISINLSSSDLATFDTLLEERIPMLTQNKNLEVGRVDIGSFSQFGSGYSLALNFYFNNQTKTR